MGRGGRKPRPSQGRRKVLAVVAFAGLLLAASLMLWFFAEGQRYTVAGLSLAWILSGIIAIWLQCSHTATPKSWMATSGSKLPAGADNLIADFDQALA
jgi:hypothetical protein